MNGLKYACLALSALLADNNVCGMNNEQNNLQSAAELMQEVQQLVGLEKTSEQNSLQSVAELMQVVLQQIESKEINSLTKGLLMNKIQEIAGGMQKRMELQQKFERQQQERNALQQKIKKLQKESARLLQTNGQLQQEIEQLQQAGKTEREWIIEQLNQSENSLLRTEELMRLLKY